ncbi:unnamed protein product [Ixodes pacificus]
MDPGQTTLVRSAEPTVRPPINWASAIGFIQATSSSGPSLQCSSVAASRAVLDQAEPDRLQNSPLPCSSAVMRSAALDPSQATSSSGLFAGPCKCPILLSWSKPSCTCLPQAHEKARGRYQATPGENFQLQKDDSQTAETAAEDASDSFSSSGNNSASCF